MKFCNFSIAKALDIKCFATVGSSEKKNYIDNLNIELPAPPKLNSDIKKIKFIFIEIMNMEY